MYSRLDAGTMRAITLRLEESTIESLDAEADEHGQSRSEYVRDVLRARSEYDELKERIRRLEVENERLRREKRQLLEVREENTELVRYAETERAYREAGLVDRLKWWFRGRDRDRDD
jgi:metal-responsive CopG/Arc/MetJ family transcriptional regulator